MMFMEVERLIFDLFSWFQHPVYAVQVQEDGILSTTGMQQIVLVTDPEQLAALQQLAQQGHLESVLAITEQNTTAEES